MGYYDYTSLESIQIRDEVAREYTVRFLEVILKIYTPEFYSYAASPHELANLLKQTLQHQDDLAQKRAKTAEWKISGLENKLAEKDAKLKEYEETILWLQHDLEGKNPGKKLS